jgi:hypothetical protein
MSKKNAKPQRTAPAADPAPEGVAAPPPQAETQAPGPASQDAQAPAQAAPVPAAAPKGRPRYIDIINDAGRKRQCVDEDFPTFAKRGFRRVEE